MTLRLLHTGLICSFVLSGPAMMGDYNKAYYINGKNIIGERGVGGRES